MVRRDDITIATDESVIEFTLKSSKTDPFRQGVTILLFATNSEICPVFAMKQYLQLKGKQPGGAPLFSTIGGLPLCRAVFINHLKSLMQFLGYNSQLYSGHSFRSGAATSAAQRGVGDCLIKTLGRWSSDCYNRYIHISKDMIKQAQCRISQDKSI